jgi:RNA polymerase sigma factor (sigma-70 family)
MKVTNRSIRFDDLLTPDIYERLLNLAKRFAAKSLEGLEAEDLVQEAIRSVVETYQGRYHDIKDLGATLTQAMTNDYRNWLERVKPWHLRKEMLTDFLDPIDASGGAEAVGVLMPESLTVSSGEFHTILQHDVETAIGKLSPADQRLVRAYMQTDNERVGGPFSNRQTAQRLGLPHATVARHITKVLWRLRWLLADYAPSSGKRMRDSPQDDAA